MAPTPQSLATLATPALAQSNPTAPPMDLACGFLLLASSALTLGADGKYDGNFGARCRLRGVRQLPTDSVACRHQPDRDRWHDDPLGTEASFWRELLHRIPSAQWICVWSRRQLGRSALRDAERVHVRQQLAALGCRGRPPYCPWGSDFYARSVSS